MLRVKSYGELGFIKHLLAVVGVGDAFRLVLGMGEGGLGTESSLIPEKSDSSWRIGSAGTGSANREVKEQRYI
jgi:hypothetical protein